ncbi:cytochrome c family protein [Blastomonas sp.]|uniref:c-type cytochrome n=1 Tax=Blastomonas sp. TaxID=1909299 RepID=UPI00359339E6
MMRSRNAWLTTAFVLVAIIALGTSAIVMTAARATEVKMPSGDATRGAAIYESNCIGCHSLDSNRVGPAHRGVFGRKAGSAPGFAYSTGLKKAKFAWDAARLDAWLTNPQAYVKGAKMGFRLSDAQRRADVIAYLKRESGK